MFQIDPAGNCLTPFERRSFAELGIGERAHLQEWIEGRPDALGEEFLILGKEFGGLSGTRARVDLLALDRSGRLVVIETKLDSTGKDVVWQAAKYAAHAAAMDRAQVTDAHQRSLDRAHVDADAEARIARFLDQGTALAPELNPARSQRIILVAGHFPAEVGATVLWLRDHGLAIQCFTATPMTRGSDLFLDLKQVIPGPDEARFLPQLDPSGVGRPQRSPISAAAARHRMAFWTRVLDWMCAAKTGTFAGVPPSAKLWISAPAGVPGIAYRLSIGQTFAQVELQLEVPDRAENDRLFEDLRGHAAQIEAAFGAALNWRFPRNVPTRAVAFTRSFETSRQQNWPAIALWFIEHTEKLERALKPFLSSCVHLTFLADE